MKIGIICISSVLLYLIAIQFVSGCDDLMNCIECLQSENCQFLQCGKRSHCMNKTDDELICQIDDSLKIETVTNIHHCSHTDLSNETIVINTESPIVNTIPTNSTTSTTPLITSEVPITNPTSRPSSSSTTTNTATSSPSSSSLSSPESPSSLISMSTPMGHSMASINRRFDGPSFIGGIILTVGLIAVTLVGYKFYRARNERNYHTLPGI